jgi:hypothetical protein
MNKLQPGSIEQIDPCEDSKLRTLNVTKFIASCSANGLPPEDLFLRDDLIEGTSDCLAHVAKTIITLVKWAETPVPTHSHLLHGGASKPKPINITLANAAPGSPYHTGPSSRAVMSSPNLSGPIPRHHYCTHVFPLHEVPASTSHNHQLAFPRCGLTVQIRLRPAMWGWRSEWILPGTSSDRDKVPPILVPRSPVRSRPSERDSLLVPSLNESAHMSIADSTTSRPATSQKPGCTQACWTLASD